MVWQISTESGEYRIQNNKSNSYGGTFFDYLTIKESGNIGINTEDPAKLLDINGDALINGILQASNIIGNEHNEFNNILKLNYEDGEANSNLLYVYGDSSFYGKIGIGVSEPENALDIIGNIKCDEIDAIGSNITLINTCNITDGILPIIRGGIGVDNIKPLQLVYGGISTVEQSSSLYWNNGTGTLNAPKFKGNGSEISSLDATNISAGTLSVSRGGTGRNNFSIGGGILVGNFFGNNQYNIAQTESLLWNNTDRSFEVTGNITGQSYVSAATALQTTPVVVASLPAAGTAGAGARAFVSDANDIVFNAVVAGTGANNLPVFSDGTDWRVG